ncbi:MAG: hypothetical protein ACI835_000044 [Planctomycetota bacterium]|jgi:hypothetical protein
MIREHLLSKRVPADPMLRWRGDNVSRIEGFPNGVFGVTLTLLIVSTAVPNTFHHLWATVHDLPAFLVSFVLLMTAWHYHDLHFHRYGLQDFWAIGLNAAFISRVVLSAYPLKFLATFLSRLVLGMDTSSMLELPARSCRSTHSCGPRSRSASR